MFRKCKPKAVVEREAVSDLAGRTAVAAGHAAERAAHAAREARRVATPAVRNGTRNALEALGEAAERAAEVLTETAEKLAVREKLAEHAEPPAVTPRPKKKHRVCKLLFLGAVAGGIMAVAKSPLKTKLANKLFGEPADDEEIEAITLPVDEAPDGEATSAPSDEAEPPHTRKRHTRNHSSETAETEVSEGE